MKKHVILAGGIACFTGLGMLAYLLYPAPGANPAFSCHGVATLLGQDPSRPSFHGTFTFRADNGSRAFLVLNGTVSAGGKEYPLNRMRTFDYTRFEGGTYEVRARQLFRYEQDTWPVREAGGTLPELLFSARTDGAVTMVDVDPLQAPAGFLITAGPDTRLLCTEN
ncbi:hypothetical protein WJU79_004249 [Citrobacter freundii]